MMNKTCFLAIKVVVNDFLFKLSRAVFFYPLENRKIKRIKIIMNTNSTRIQNLHGFFFLKINIEYILFNRD
jgi:hypothetical protein